MIQVSVQEAQKNLEQLLTRVEEGETIIVTRPGCPPVRLSLVQEEEGGALPPLREWRKDLHVKGEALSKTVQHQRNEERY